MWCWVPSDLVFCAGCSYSEFLTLAVSVPLKKLRRPLTETPTEYFATAVNYKCKFFMKWTTGEYIITRFSSIDAPVNKTTLSTNSAFWAQSGTPFTTLPFLRNLRIGQQARVLDYTWLERLANDEHSSILDPFVSCEENEVFWIRSQLHTIVEHPTSATFKNIRLS
jgi:hypothetical protein